MIQASFRKGEEFKKFVENQLFHNSDYELIDRTDSFEQNKDQYEEDTRKPDFKFRCRKMDKEFYVEAKFYANFNPDEMLEVINFLQLERFRSLEQLEDIPVFVVVGYIGLPIAPKYISLIPLQELKDSKLTPSFLKSFAIEKTVVQTKKLKLDEQITPTDMDNESTSQENDNSFKNNKLAYAIMSLAVLIFLSLGFKSTHKYSLEQKLRQKTFEYYAVIEDGNLDALENYLSSKVQKWYTTSDVNFEQIKADALAYQKKYPNTSISIQWDTFEFISMPTEEYKTSYDMIYKIESTNSDKDLTYHLKINVTWDQDFKIKSIFENRIKA